MKITVAVVCGFLLVGTAQARTEYRLGGENGNPWLEALGSDDAGEYLIFATDGQIADSVPVGTTPFGVGQERMLDFVGTSVRPRFIEAHVNLAKTDPDSPGSEIPLPYTGGRIQAATSCVHAGGEVQLMKPMFDGDPSTALFAKVRAQHLGGGGGQAETHVHPVMDFTAAVPVNRIRFYPRLGQRDDIRVIEALTAPFYALDLFSPDSFIENILGGYEIRTGDDSINIFITGPCDRTPNGTHSVHPNWVGSADERLDVLKSTTENLEVVVDASFPTRSVRWLTFAPKAIVNWEIAELEV